MEDIIAILQYCKEKISLLTVREAKVFRYVGECSDNKEIGDKLFITESTVKKHLEEVYRKMGFKDRYKLVIASFLYNRFVPEDN